MDKAIRLIVISTENGGFEIHSADRLQAPVPEPENALKVSKMVAGRHMEIRSENGELLHSTLVESAMPSRVEYPTGDSERPFGRVDAPPGTVYSLVVPDHPEAGRLELVEIETSYETLDKNNVEPERRRLAHIDIAPDGAAVQ